jgi:hypothetical protein
MIDVIGTVQQMMLLVKLNNILSCLKMIAYNPNINDGPHALYSGQVWILIDGTQFPLYFKIGLEYRRCCKPSNDEIRFLQTKIMASNVDVVNLDCSMTQCMKLMTMVTPIPLMGSIVIIPLHSSTIMGRNITEQLEYLSGHVLRYKRLSPLGDETKFNFLNELLFIPSKSEKSLSLLVAE